jgi:hypothetical protein
MFLHAAFVTLLQYMGMISPLASPCMSAEREREREREADGTSIRRRIRRKGNLPLDSYRQRMSPTELDRAVLGYYPHKTVSWAY